MEAIAIPYHSLECLPEHGLRWGSNVQCAMCNVPMYPRPPEGLLLLRGQNHMMAKVHLHSVDVGMSYKVTKFGTR